MNESKQPRITIDTNVISVALNTGRPFRAHLDSGACHAYVAETSLTLDGLLTARKIDLLALKDVRHAFRKRRWDDYVAAGASFLLCPRILLPRPTYTNAFGVDVEYTLEHKADEHTYPQAERQQRYFEVLRYIEGQLTSGRQWLSELEAEVTQKGGTVDPEVPWYLNVARNIDVIGENAFKRRFGDWADADAIAAHYAYGNDLFCTNDGASGAGARSVLSAANRKNLTQKYGIVFVSLDEVCTQLA